MPSTIEPAASGKQNGSGKKHGEIEPGQKSFQPVEQSAEHSGASGDTSVTSVGSGNRVRETAAKPFCNEYPGGRQSKIPEGKEVGEATIEELRCQELLVRNPKDCYSPFKLADCSMYSKP